MILKIYKIQDNGIWIPKNELEEWYDHYTKLSARYSKDDIELAMFYAGMADVLSDMIKHIEQ